MRQAPCGCSSLLSARRGRPSSQRRVRRADRVGARAGNSRGDRLRVQSFYDQTRTFQADFKQNTSSKMHDQRRTSEGRVGLRKNLAKMSWKYDQPNGNRVVSDGRVLRSTNARTSRCSNSRSTSPSIQRRSPSSWAGRAHQVVRAAPPRCNRGEVRRRVGSRGHAQGSDAGLSEVLLYVDAATSQVRRVLISRRAGNRNRFDFTNPVVNTPVPPAVQLLSARGNSDRQALTRCSPQPGERGGYQACRGAACATLFEKNVHFVPSTRPPRPCRIWRGSRANPLIPGTLRVRHEGLVGLVEYDILPLRRPYRGRSRRRATGRGRALWSTCGGSLRSVDRHG